MKKGYRNIATKYKNIRLIFNDKNESVGYLLVISRKKIRYSETFNFSKFGGKENALNKTLLAKENIIKDIDKIIAKRNNRSERYKRITDKIYSSNNVYYTTIDIWEQGIMKRKRISVSKDAFTEEQAITYLLEQRSKFNNKTKHFKDGYTKTRYEHVYRYFNKDLQTIGFKVDFSIKGKRVCKCFNNKKYGGYAPALIAATKYRDECLKDLV